ncbi:hypothetical protein B0H17DRAFT_1197442 [Mycena rosella]|uniref:Uncharacterized protein n=1 Tax=Mycena rosella TaxID=1033263 RepID=A0AAD7DQJ3_MYCRO|nr:hypothetical protein B0H17DRAFT_1197442 [Mycena rosella]
MVAYILWRTRWCVRLRPWPASSADLFVFVVAKPSSSLYTYPCPFPAETPYPSHPIRSAPIDDGGVSQSIPALPDTAPATICARRDTQIMEGRGHSYSMTGRRAYGASPSSPPRAPRIPSSRELATTHAEIRDALRAVDSPRLVHIQCHMSCQFRNSGARRGYGAGAMGYASAIAVPASSDYSPAGPCRAASGERRVGVSEGGGGRGAPCCFFAMRWRGEGRGGAERGEAMGRKLYSAKRITGGKSQHMRKRHASSAYLSHLVASSDQRRWSRARTNEYDMCYFSFAAFACEARRSARSNTIARRPFARQHIALVVGVVGTGIAVRGARCGAWAWAWAWAWATRRSRVCKATATGHGAGVRFVRSAGYTALVWTRETRVGEARGRTAGVKYGRSAGSALAAVGRARSVDEAAAGMEGGREKGRGVRGYVRTDIPAPSACPPRLQAMQLGICVRCGLRLRCGLRTRRRDGGEERWMKGGIVSEARAADGAIYALLGSISPLSFLPFTFSAHPQSERARSSASCRSATQH